MINHQTASHLAETAADAVQADGEGFGAVLDEIPAPIYVVGRDGTLKYFNPACVEFAGRTPRPGVDKWCVSWRLYTAEGDYLPHDQCPMAVAVREARPLRGLEAVAERPDGSRLNFVPYPQPLFDDAGEPVGGVNLLLDVTEQRRSEYLREQAEEGRRLAAAIDDAGTAEALSLMADKYDEQLARQAR